MTLTCLYDGIADRPTCFQLLNRLQERTQNLDGSWTENPHHGPIEAGQWFEIEGAEYDYFLNLLPPLVFDGCAFAMSEYKTFDLTDAFFDLSGRFFCVTVDISEGTHPRAVLNQTGHALREAIQ